MVQFTIIIFNNKLIVNIILFNHFDDNKYLLVDLFFEF